MEKGGRGERGKERKEKEKRESGGEGGRKGRKKGNKEAMIKRQKSVKTPCANIALFTQRKVYNVIERQSNKC